MTTEPNTSTPEPEDASSPGTSTGLITIIIHHSITVLILILFLALGVWSYLNFQATDFFTTLDHDDLETHFYPPLERAQQQRFETAIEVYSLRHDRYPRQLDELTQAGLLMSADLYYPREPSFWAYEAQGEQYTLELTPPPKED